MLEEQDTTQSRILNIEKLQIASNTSRTGTPAISDAATEGSDGEIENAVQAEKCGAQVANAGGDAARDDLKNGAQP